MAKSKKRKKSKTQPQRKTKVFRLSQKQLKYGAEEHLKRETKRILQYIEERKAYEKDSEKYNELSTSIKYLIKSYNFTAELWGLDTI